MKFMRWVIGGLTGALIGAVIWVVTGYLSGLEVGWIAWGIGLLAGLGTRFSTRREEQAAGSIVQGVTAAVVAVAVVLGAKCVVVLLQVRDARQEVRKITEKEASDEAMIMPLANLIAKERTDAGQPLDWPPGITYDTASQQAHYPDDVWTAAEERWRTMPEVEREAAREERRKMMRQLEDAIGAELERSAFSEFFHAIDVLWIGLAMFTAFRVGMAD